MGASFSRRSVLTPGADASDSALGHLVYLASRPRTTETPCRDGSSACFSPSESISRDVARGCAARGLLFKRTAYNFVSLAHDEVAVDRTLEVLDEVLTKVLGES